MNYKGRLVYELIDLTEKLTKLNSYIDSIKDEKIVDEKEVQRLVTQQEAMMTYHLMLTERLINLLGGYENE